MRVYLIGYMACGKSWLGKELASATGLDFIDVDKLFEHRYRVTILDFFEKYGEGLFRKLEREMLKETLMFDNAIIATGGGAPCFFNNMELIRSAGKSIYLRMDAGDLLKRIKAMKKRRPLLKNVGSGQLAQFVTEQLAKREPYYLMADHVFQGPDYPVEEIVRVIGSLT